MNPFALKASIAAILTLGAFYGGYKAGSLSGDAKVAALEKNIALERLSAQELLNQEVSENEKLKDQLHAQTIENRKIVDAARRDLAAVRVRLPASVCADYGSPGATGGSQPAAAGSGIFPKPADGAAGNAQLALDDFIAGIKADAEAADGVVGMCRPVMDWARR